MHRIGELRARVERTFVGRCIGEFVGLGGLDRAMAIAAQAFTALIPLLLLISAIAPTGSRNAVADAIVRRFRLTGEAADEVQVLFAPAEAGAVGVLSLVLLVFSGVSLTRRVQRMYLQAWRLPGRTGLRASLDAMAGLAVLVLEISLLYFARQLLGSAPLPSALGWPVSLLAGLALWTTVPWLLLDRRVPWRRLLPAGGLTAVGAAAYGIATTIYMPRLMESYSRRYGIFGITLALVSWLLCIALVLVAATVIATEFDRAPDAWARRLRVLLHLEVGAVRSQPAPSGPEPRSPRDAGRPRVRGGPPDEPTIEGRAREL